MFYGNNHDFLQICTGKSDETENGKKRLFGRWRREMFREIRKKKNAITADAAESLLEKSRRGVLAVNGDDGYPYAIPVNYFYDRNEQKIYFHGARAGHKVDALRASDKVCFTITENHPTQKRNFYMDLRILRYFLTVAKEQSFTKAAEQLHITQPTLSRQLAAFEEERHRSLRSRSNNSAGKKFRNDKTYGGRV